MNNLDEFKQIDFKSLNESAINEMVADVTKMDEDTIMRCIEYVIDDVYKDEKDENSSPEENKNAAMFLKHESIINYTRKIQES